MKYTQIMAFSVLIVLTVLVVGCGVKTVGNETVTCPVTGESTDPACRIPGMENQTTEAAEPEEPEMNGTRVTSEVRVNITQPKTQEQLQNVSQIITGVEGDLLELRPIAVSPEGAKITYTFSKPFNTNGLWQTRDGDAGKHLITITASDGILSAAQSVLVEIAPSNKAPKIECPDEIIVNEGDTIRLDCNIFDIDADEVVVTYSGFMSSPSYTTTYDDAGSYTVVVRAADESHITTATVPVIVKNVNRAPIIRSPFEDFSAKETDVVALNVDAYDPDGDPISITYSTPFDEQGVWRTKVGDAGNYVVSVVIADYELTTKKQASLKLKPINTAPVLKEIAPIIVREGQELFIDAEAYDREDDELIITYADYMTSSKKMVPYTDAYPDGCGVPLCNATYIVTVAVTDGSLSDSQDVLVMVVDTWRGPVFEAP